MLRSNIYHFLTDGLASMFVTLSELGLLPDTVSRQVHILLVPAIAQQASLLLPGWTPSLSFHHETCSVTGKSTALARLATQERLQSPMKPLSSKITAGQPAPASLVQFKLSATALI